MAKKRREVQLEKKNSKKYRNSNTNSKPKKSNKVRFTLILLILLTVIVGYFFYTKMLVPSREAKRPLSILLVGSDISDFREDYFMGSKPEKTDSLMVITFNPNTYTVDMTSIPRDTSIDYVCDSIQDINGASYDGEAYQDQINELYQVSGKSIDCLSDSISQFLNVPIDYYVKVNMDQLAGIIDAIGGITLTVHAADYNLSQENASLTNTYYWTDGEKVTMDGDEALTYARARHDSEADYGRGIRQQQVVSAIGSNVLNAGFSMDLVNSLVTLVETDMPIKLIYEYYQYFMAINVMSNMISGEKTEAQISELPDTVWLNLYDLAGFEGKRTAKDINSQKDVDNFLEYLQSGVVDQDALKEKMIKNHQFYNSAYSGHYNVVYDQLYEISNELRKNLELSEEDVTVPSNPYGDNYAKGLMPSETTKAKQGLA